MHQVILRPSLVCGSFCTSTGQPGSHCSTFRWSFKIVCNISTSSQAKNRQQSLCNCSSHCYMHSCTPRQFCISSYLHGISTFLDTLNAVCGSDYCPKLTACAFAKRCDTSGKGMLQTSVIFSLSDCMTFAAGLSKLSCTSQSYILSMTSWA